MEAAIIWIVIPLTRCICRRQQLRYLISQCNTWSLRLFCKSMMVLTLQRLLYARTWHIFRFMLTILQALLSSSISSSGAGAGASSTTTGISKSSVTNSPASSNTQNQMKSPSEISTGTSIGIGIVAGLVICLLAAILLNFMR